MNIILINFFHLSTQGKPVKILQSDLLSRGVDDLFLRSDFATSSRSPRFVLALRRKRCDR